MMAGTEHPGQDDVQGHYRAWSDETLKDGIQELERALAGLRELQTTQGEDDDVQGHGYTSWSDERLKQAVVKVEDALAGLRQLQSTQGEASDVQGHAFYGSWSDERLKQAVAEVEDALASLREIPTGEGQDDEVQGHVRLSADKGLEQPIGSLQRALATLRPGTGSR
jgi:DNA repair ATPase RecN